MNFSPPFFLLAFPLPPPAPRVSVTEVDALLSSGDESDGECCSKWPGAELDPWGLKFSAPTDEVVGAGGGTVGGGGMPIG